MAEPEELEALIRYVTSHGRVCPKPRRWNRIWQNLPGRTRVRSGWNPPVPLILGGWWSSSDGRKRERLATHIRWANANGAFAQIDRALRRLPEEDWHHDELTRRWRDCADRWKLRNRYCRRQALDSVSLPMDSNSPEDDDQFASQLAATLGDPEMVGRFRLLDTVRRAARASFKYDKAPRPARIPDALRALRSSITACDMAAVAASPHLWPYVGIGDMADLAKAENSPIDLLGKIDAYLDGEVEHDSEIVLDRRGGRAADARLTEFAARLAMIFRDTTGKRPTFTFDKENGAYASQFALFAYEAFCQCLPDDMRKPGGKLPEGAIQLAGLRAVRMEREYEFASPGRPEKRRGS